MSVRVHYFFRVIGSAREITTLTDCAIGYIAWACYEMRL